MDLGEARVRECGAPLICAPDRRRIRSLRVGGQIEDVSVAASRQNHRLAGVRLDSPGHEVTSNNTSRLSVDHHQVEHLAARKHLHSAASDLPFERLVGAEEELLPCLATRIEGSGHLRATE